MAEKIGVFLCDCSQNIAGKIDLDEIKNKLGAKENIVFCERHRLLCAPDGKKFLATEAKKNNFTKVVISACSPRTHEKTFRNVLEESGFNPFNMQMVNLREHCAYVTKDKEGATRKAISMLNGAIKRVEHHEPLEKKHLEVNPDVLIIGGGVAGIEAALCAAKSNRNVYILEKKPSIGGEVVKYEDLAPEMECAPCFMAPRLSEIRDTENIKTLANSEILDVLGFLGNFKVKLKQKARYVKIEDCIGCEECFSQCPVSVKSEIDYNLGERKAIYIQFPGSHPNCAIIDKENCLRFKGEECDKCSTGCPFGAINYEDTDKEIEIKVGSIIVATGADTFDPTPLKNLGYGQFENIYTSAEFERLLSTNGPTDGEILLENGEIPKKVAIIHCVGSINKEHKYCSSICCLSALKFSHLLKKKDKDIKITHLYPYFNYSCSGTFKLKEDLTEDGVEMIHINSVEQLKVIKNGSSFNLNYGQKEDEVVGADVIVLVVGMIPGKNQKELAELLDIELNEDGFFESSHSKLESTSATLEGIYIAGCAKVPSSIERSIIEGQSAVGNILSSIKPGEKIELEAITAFVEEDKCGGCKTCISMCPYKAIFRNEGTRKAEVNEALCRGCGTCVASCPASAMKARHFTDKQIISEIGGLL